MNKVPSKVCKPKKKVVSKKKQSKKKRGYSLVELILAMALFSMFAGAIIFLVLGSFGSNQRASRLTEAKSYLEQSNEAMRAISLEAFNYLEAGEYGLNYNSTDNKWELASSPDDPDGSGPFISRTIVVEDVSRDTSGDIGTEENDAYTRKATVNLIWDIGGGKTTNLSSELYLTAWEANDWEQTDWVGGNGQNEWSDETMYESDDGNIDVSTSGQVSLSEILSEYTHNWPYTDSANYDLSDDTKIEVADGVAKLIKADNVLTSLNQDFSAGTGSEPDNWGNGNGYGTWNKTSGGYDDNYFVDISFPNNSSTILTDYWEQMITIDSDNPSTASLTFKWKCSDYLVRDPDQLTLFVTLDSASGTPLLANAISSVDITSSGTWQTFTISDLTTELATAGDYYLKVALYVDYKNGKKQGPFTVDIDNVDLEWGTNSYSSDKPYVEVNDDGMWDPDYLGMITGFTETATKDTGTQIYYQISKDNGGSWYYYDTTAQEWGTTSDPDEANDATDINDFIKYLPVDDDSQIKIRAYLESDGGDHQVELNNIELSYNPDTITLEAGSAVVTESWSEISLDNSYTNPVVVATYHETNTDSPGSVRIRNAGSNSFEARIEFPTDNYNPKKATANNNIDYLVVEQGYWITDTGVSIEAYQHDTATIGRKGSWRADAITYNLQYSNPPVVLHQVMSAVDTSWITSWVSEIGRTVGAPTTTGFQIGLNAAEVVDSYLHGPETIGYIIIEDVLSDNVDGNNLETRITPRSIDGHDNGCNNYNTYSSYTKPVIIASQQGMFGGDGGWIVRCGAYDNRARFHIEEDQFQNLERNHNNEIGAWLVFEDGMSVNGKASIGNYQTSGHVISSAYTIDNNANILSWDADDSCTDCAVYIQLRFADDCTTISSADWYGAEGLGTNYLESSGYLLDVNEYLDKKCIQYKAYLEGDGTATPVLNSVNVNYY